MSAIMGIDMVTAHPCGAKLKLCWCTAARCGSARTATKSQILVWKCASCGKRHGRPDEQTIKTIEQFVRRYGWTWRPLIMSDDGAIRVY